MKHVVIYTDGACIGNPGPGGWGILMRYNDQEKTWSGGEPDTTNNRMEMTAAIKALGKLREACRVDLHTDSQYVQKGITQWINAWKKRQWKKSDRTPVKNADLWEILDSLTQKHQITWHWVRGHNGHPENERVDALARTAAEKFR